MKNNYTLLLTFLFLITSNQITADEPTGSSCASCLMGFCVLVRDCFVEEQAAPKPPMLRSLSWNTFGPPEHEDPARRRDTLYDFATTDDD